MPFAPFDVAGLVLFLGLSFFFYRKGWFFSFYSFFKFLLIIALSLALGIIISSKLPVRLPITNLQFSLIIQGIAFVILWRIISFKKIFFKATDSVFSLNRFIFIHHLDKFLNIIPSFVASFFLTFFLFTVAVSASTYVTGLAAQIESSKIVKPLSYEIYFATISPSRFGLFQNVAYKLVPEFNPGDEAGNLSNATETAIGSFSQRLAQENYYIPQQPGTSPLLSTGGGQTFTPPQGPVQAPSASNTVQNNSTTVYAPPVQDTQPVTNSTKIIIFPTSTPVPTSTPIPTPTPTSIQYFPPQQNPSQNQTPQIYPTPTLTPTPIPMPSQPNELISPNISQAEQDIFNKTNQERAAGGLAPLVWSDALAAVARTHSKDMATRHFFDHVNPDGLDPFQRLKIGGITFLSAGENIAGGPSADIIMTNWMNSPGHRANILNSSFGHIGVGVAVDSQYGLVATQDFTN